MNFWQKTVRFLEPAMRMKGAVVWQFLVTSIYQIGILIPIILLMSYKTSGDIEEMVFVFLFWFVVIGYYLLRAFRDYFWVYPAYTAFTHINTQFVSRMLTVQNLAFENYGTGRVLNIVDRGMSTWYMLLTELLNFSFHFLFIWTFIVVRIMMVNIWYGLGAIGVFFVVIGWVVWNNTQALKWKTRLKETESEHTRRLVKICMSKFEILQNKKMHSETEKLASNIAEQKKYSSLRSTYIWLMYDTPFFAFILFVVSVYFASSLQMITLSDSAFIEFIGIAFLAQSLIFPFVDFVKDFSKDFVHIEKLWDFMDTTPQIEWYETGSKFHFQKGNYELQNLSFLYNNSATVLDNFSCTIQWGKKTALVGRSWGGKTTLMKLLAWYMRPTSGTLLIDGQDITGIRLDSYYAHIGYLTQEPSVFDGTIEENLLYSVRGKITKKDIEEAIEMAECQFIYELEYGLQTEIGERGIRLSGGQKQRLAIAKIFLKDPEIILLDEPTAALDSYSEQKVAKAFERLFAGRTVIVIAHRLQTVKSADDIIVLEKGKIAERWTHKQLLKLGGKYAGMVDLQSGVVREGDEE
jgi:ATP-binding cassette, subfamily B, bacterial